MNSKKKKLQTKYLVRYAKFWVCIIDLLIISHRVMLTQRNIFVNSIQFFYSVQVAYIVQSCISINNFSILLFRVFIAFLLPFFITFNITELLLLDCLVLKNSESYILMLCKTAYKINMLFNKLLYNEPASKIPLRSDTLNC